MFIQKIDIYEPFIQKLNKNIRLTKNSSETQLPSVNKNINKKNYLPYVLKDAKIKTDTIQSNIINSFDMRNVEQNNITSDFYSKYKPRRNIILKQTRAKSQTSLMDLRKMPLNENKVFNSEITHNDNKIINILKSTEKKQDDVKDEEELLKFQNYSFRYKSLLKIEKNIEMFNSIKKMNTDLITSSRVATYDDIISKLTKIMNEQKLIFEQNLMKLDFDSENEKNDNANNKNYIQKKDFDNLIKKEVVFSCIYNNLMNRLIALLFEELNSGKERNFKLLQRNHEDDLIINTKNKALNELNRYINRYDVDTKITYIKKQEQKNNIIKQSFINKQNEYITKIYKLESEIKIMANLLNKNKIYFNKCREYEEKINTNKKETEKMKVLFKRELREKNTLFEEAVTRREELREELSNIRTYVDDLTKDKKNNKSLDIMSKAKIKKLTNMLNERNENIRMLNEELEYYLRQNYFLRKKIKERELTIVTMEMKIKKEKEKEGIENDTINI